MMKQRRGKVSDMMTMTAETMIQTFSSKQSIDSCNLAAVCRELNQLIIIIINDNLSWNCRAI